MDEVENIGGIGVDIVVDLADAEARIARLEARLAKLSQSTYTVHVVGDVPAGLAGRPSRSARGGAGGSTAAETTLKLEANAAKKLATQIGKITVPVTLELKPSEITRIKKQIAEAFSGFVVDLKMNYEADDREMDQIVPGTEGSVRRSRAPRGRIQRGTVVQAAPQAAAAPFDRNTAIRNNENLIKELKTAITHAQSTPGYPQTTLRELTSELAKRERRLNILQNTPAGQLREERPAEAPPVAGGRVLSANVRRLRQTPLRRQVPRPYLGPAVPAGLFEPVPARPLIPYDYDPMNSPIGLSDAENEAAEQAFRRDQAYARLNQYNSGQSAGETNKFSPRERSYRAFDRTRIARKGGRRRGPARTITPGPDPSRGFFEPFAPNRVIRGEFDPRGALPVDPRLRDIAIRYARGEEFGTFEEPLIQGPAGRGPITPEQEARLAQLGGSVRSFLGKEFLGTAGEKYKVLSPRDLALQAASEREGEKSYLDLAGEGSKEKFLNYLRSVRPGTGVAGERSGGYVTASQGGLPIATAGPSDTPAGRALARQRTAALSGQQTVGATDPTTGKRVEFSLSQEDLEQTALQRQLMRDLPAARGYGKIDTIFQQFESGDVNYEDIEPKYLPRSAFTGGDRNNEPTGLPLNPATLFYARLRQFEARYKAQQKVRKLPPEIQEEIDAAKAEVKLRRSAMREAADRYVSTERAPGARAGRRGFTQPESQLAAIQDRIRQIKGTGGTEIAVANTEKTGREFEERYNPAQRKYRRLRPSEPGAQKALASGRGIVLTDPGHKGLLDTEADPTKRAALERELADLQREYTALLPIAEAARLADAERSGAKINPKTGRTYVPTEPRVLSGTALSNKVLEATSAPYRVTDIPPEEAPEPVPGGAMPLTYDAAKLRGGPVGTPRSEAYMEGVAEARAITQRAVEGAGAGGGDGGEKPVALRPSGGGAIRVHVVNFNELKGILAASGGKSGLARAAAEKEPGIGGAAPSAAASKKLEDDKASARSAAEVAQRARLRRATAGRLVGSLAEQGINIDLAEAEPRPFTGKSPAQVEAEAEILQARALSPTRAFTTAVAAASAKTFGGGRQFEERVKQLGVSLRRRADIATEAADTTRELRAVSTNLNRVGRELETRGNRGEAIPGELEQLRRNLSGQQSDLRRRLVEQRAQRAAATAEVQERRGSLISPVGVARGFAALGLGAIGAGVVFRAASQAVETVVQGFVEGATKATDALTGFSLTTNRVTSSLTESVRAGAGNIPAAISGALAPTGANRALFEGVLGGGLAQRAEAQAAARAQGELGDILKSSLNVAGNRTRGGFDRALFEGTGGVLGGPIAAPQQGFLEQVNNNLEALRNARTLESQRQQGSSTNILGSGMLSLPGMQEPTGPTPAVTEFDQYVSDLSENLNKANSAFELTTSATKDQREAMISSAKAIGQEAAARKLADQGIVLTGRRGRALQGFEFGTAVQDLARGTNIVNPAVAIEQDKRGLTAAFANIRRQRQRQLEFTLPIQAGLSALAQPAMAPGTGIAAVGADEQERLATSVDKTASLQARLNSYYDKGKKLLQDSIPKDLYNDIKTIGEEIVRIQTGLSNRQATLQAHEYSNQLRVAERSLNEINALIGKGVKGEGGRIGALERENLLLSRQGEQLQLQLQQRQINFQLAIAGFQTPGETPEERAARRKDAETQASYAQKLLDIQKQSVGNQVKLVDLQNAQQAVDLLKSIELLREGRAVVFDAALAEQELARLNKLQDQSVARAGTYINAVEAQVQVAYGELQKLEAAYGDALSDITTTTLNEFIRYATGLRNAITSSGYLPTGGGNTKPVASASGSLFNTAGTTSMIVGEAGTETVAVLRNPRVTPMGGGGGGVTIHINGPVVRDESDIAKIARAVEEVLNRRTQLLGLR